MNVHFSTLQCACCDECTSLLFPRPASSTSAGNLPHFPEWLWTTPRERARPCHMQFWVWTARRRWRERRRRWSRMFFPLRELCRFPHVLKLRFAFEVRSNYCCRWRIFLSFSVIMDFSLWECWHWWKKWQSPRSEKRTIYSCKGLMLTALESVLWNPRGWIPRTFLILVPTRVYELLLLF